MFNMDAVKNVCSRVASGVNESMDSAHARLSISDLSFLSRYFTMSG